jgi:hypothetical protein
MRDTNTVEVPTIELTTEELSAVAAGTLHIGNVAGESTDKDHKDWVSILKYDHAITQPPTGR